MPYYTIETFSNLCNFLTIPCISANDEDVKKRQKRDSGIL
ncbi:hypothetical protein CLOSYM_00267 [[Clostridium] symbiosum ATCC 14940]|uniref:Uncharacterized protein n=1 Tax=[Clostridium] symbiosum ATCC 14940 TaxID=411472 RepID=A0ABC9U3Q2_CLOSY|nr:hypothetical protein CLOSYM_00267 [[Clostridium] symbiosum ATCC 14940]